jgi:micrococcal nuclease
MATQPQRFVQTTPAATNKTIDITWQEAGKYYGSTVRTEGTIVATHNSGKVCLLNFHRDYRKYLTAAIFASDYALFPKDPDKYFLNKKVRVTGVVKEYNGKPEIILKSPTQIEVIDGN